MSRLWLPKLPTPDILVRFKRRWEPFLACFALYRFRSQCRRLHHGVDCIVLESEAIGRGKSSRVWYRRLLMLPSRSLGALTFLEYTVFRSHTTARSFTVFRPSNPPLSHRFSVLL